MKRPIALVGAASLGATLSLIMAVGAILTVIGAWLLSINDDDESGRGWLVAGVALAALLAAGTAVALARSAYALVAGSPRADGATLLAAVLTFVVGLVYGASIPWAGVGLLLAGIALALLVTRNAVGAHLARSH
jgi:hypothetical protein